jgi:hypothetical protein
MSIIKHQKLLEKKLKEFDFVDIRDLPEDIGKKKK